MKPNSYLRRDRMRIEKFHIINYKSILESGEINLDSKITTLIGKNESGKTNILKALESFKGDYEYGADDLCLHSKTRRNLDLGKVKDKDIEIMTIWFVMEDVDRQKLKELHPKLEKMKTLKVTKYFDNSYHLESPLISLKDLKNIDEEEVEKNLLKIQELATSFLSTLKDHSKRYTPFATSESQFEEIISSFISFDPEKDPNIDNTFNNLYNRLRNLPNRDILIQNDIETFVTEIESCKSEIKEILSVREDLENKILEVLPNFLYFTDVEKLEDIVEINEFLNNRKAHKTLANLIELCNLDIERLKDAEEYEMLSDLELASTSITGMVNQSWKQEKVNVKIGIVRDQIVVSISDDVIRKEHPPSIRSQGFQWFLSFYINFTAGSKGEFENTVILLDDPGVYLHPSGQKDLLDTLERISQSNQIIFSTHSPFMVDRKKLKRTRIVSKKKGKGTLIEEKYYKSDYDALQPIRAAIGMTIGDSLFFSKKNLLVEGYSDELILGAMSDICSKEGKICIDTSNIAILPVNGANKMPYFATLLEKENIDYLILLDEDKKGRDIANELKEKFSINENKIITLGIIGEKGEDKEIEDLINIDFYLHALNLAYKKEFQEKLEKESINKKDLPKASFGGVKRFFREKQIEENKRIDKIKAAKKIYDLIAENRLPNKDTISDFAEIFKIINDRLGIQQEGK